MSVCLLAGAVALTLAAPEFMLSWTHSVERVEWQEDWRVGDDALTLLRARVKGSGAGMDPGEGATLRDGWWGWPVGLTLPSVSLAASGATGAGWTLCAGGDCTVLGADAGAPVTLAPCDP